MDVRSRNRSGRGDAAQARVWRSVLRGAWSADCGPRVAAAILENRAERLCRDTSWFAAVHGGHRLDGVPKGRRVHHARKLHELADVVLYQDLRQVLAGVDRIQLECRCVRCERAPDGHVAGNLAGDCAGDTWEAGTELPDGSENCAICSCGRTVILKFGLARSLARGVFSTRHGLVHSDRHGCFLGLLFLASGAGPEPCGCDITELLESSGLSDSSKYGSFWLRDLLQRSGDSFSFLDRSPVSTFAGNVTACPDACRRSGLRLVSGSGGLLRTTRGESFGGLRSMGYRARDDSNVAGYGRSLSGSN